jgi:hypothetical protein
MKMGWWAPIVRRPPLPAGIAGIFLEIARNGDQITLMNPTLSYFLAGIAGIAGVSRSTPPDLVPEFGMGSPAHLGHEVLGEVSKKAAIPAISAIPAICTIHRTARKGDG